MVLADQGNQLQNADRGWLDDLDGQAPLGIGSINLYRLKRIGTRINSQAYEWRLPTR